MAENQGGGTSGGDVIIFKLAPDELFAAKHLRQGKL